MPRPEQRGLLESQPDGGPLHLRQRGPAVGLGQQADGRHGQRQRTLRRVIATVFGIAAETTYGPEGIVYIAHSNDLFGVTIGSGNVMSEIEAEVGVYLTPTEFANRASISISAAQARAILADMGTVVSSYIGLSSVTSTLEEGSRLSSDQIQQFIRAAEQLGG